MEQAALRGEFFDYSAFHVAGYDQGRPYTDFEPERDAGLIPPHHRKLAQYQYLSVARQDRYQAVPLHVHPWIELNYMFSGTCQLTIHDKCLEMHRGQFCLINTSAPHAVSACGTDDILIIFLISKPYLDSNFFSRLAKNNFLATFFIEAIQSRKEQDNYIFFHAEQNERLPLYVSQFLCEYYDNTSCMQSILDCLITLILCELINVFEDDLAQSEGHAVSPILRYIERHYVDCTLASTAAHFHLHPNYLSTFLKQHTGYTFKHLVQTQRLHQAARLLETTSLPVSDIAAHVGYANTTFFFQKFKEAYGCTPGAYRQQEGKV